ncbi:MAG: hypothetical protein Q8N60_01880 [Candidatus Diapherotrites archaeon]|nr:hypothetical protein [Candidatus Diapherotrites archaeon]
MQKQLLLFEKEYCELAEKGMPLAKQHFRENFLVRCFNCSSIVRPTEQMCCPVCGTYLD